jgi:hypothetical protein
MSSWIVVACLLKLRDEVNALAPGRDKGADGTIGDQAHADRTSDHNPDETGAVPIHDADHTNEVHALDITTELNEPGLSLETIVQFILARCRSGAERRLRYIIFNHRIWKADNDWRQEAYNLADPHTGHAHFSASYESALEASTASWHLEDIPVALTTADKQWLSAEIAKQAKAAAAAALDDACELVPFKTGGGSASQIGTAVWNSGYPAADGAQRTPAWFNQQGTQKGVTALAVDVSALKAEKA